MCGRFETGIAAGVIGGDVNMDWAADDVDGEENSDDKEEREGEEKEEVRIDNGELEDEEGGGIGG